MTYNQKKDLFVQTIDVIYKQMTQDEEFYNTTRKFDALGYGIQYNNHIIINQLITLLQKLLARNSNTDSVAWWIFETNFGKSQPIIGIDDYNFFFIDKPEDLFDFINHKYDKLKKYNKENLIHEPF